MPQSPLAPTSQPTPRLPPTPTLMPWPPSLNNKYTNQGIRNQLPLPLLSMPPLLIATHAFRFRPPLPLHNLRHRDSTRRSRELPQLIEDAQSVITEEKRSKDVPAQRYKTTDCNAIMCTSSPPARPRAKCPSSPPLPLERARMRTCIRHESGGFIIDV